MNDGCGQGQAARRLEVTEGRIVQLRMAGELKATRTAGRWLYDLGDLDRLRRRRARRHALALMRRA